MNKDNMFHIIDKDKLLKTMSPKREGIIAETSPLYEWVDGWTDCYDEMNRKTIEEYVGTLNHQTVNEAQEAILKELDNFIDKLDEVSNYASTIRQLIKNSKNNVEIVETILTFANEIDGILAKINNNFEGL